MDAVTATAGAIGANTNDYRWRGCRCTRHHSPGRTASRAGRNDRDFSSTGSWPYLQWRFGSQHRLFLGAAGRASGADLPGGEDFTGSEAEQAWREAGIKLDGIVTVPGAKSGYAYLFFEESGEAMCFAYPGAAAVAPPPLFNPHDFVVVAPVFGGFTQPLLQTALERKLRVVVSGIVAAGLVPYLPYLYALVINSGEANTLCEQLGKSSYDGLAAEFPHLLLYITKGSQGSCVYFNGRREQVAPVQAAVFIDPTGAGDSYTAGVVAALLRDLDPVTAGIVGATNASYVVEAFGAQTNLPTWPQVVARARQMGIERLGTDGSDRHA
ncbi:MAG: carbohydrate kinase family protein [Chloroflexi bacterium]|nr:carbohydrate kinase family protein [Chloroflexota bacterium]